MFNKILCQYNESTLPHPNSLPLNFSLCTFRGCFAYSLYPSLGQMLFPFPRSFMLTFSSSCVNTFTCQFSTVLVPISAVLWRCLSTDLTISFLHRRITLDVSLHVFIFHGRRWGRVNVNVVWIRKREEWRVGKGRTGRKDVEEESRTKLGSSLLPLSLFLARRTRFPKVLKTKGRKDMRRSTRKWWLQYQC